jgi:ribosomal protein S18 acetylase RimI-like enzyme
MTAEKGQVSHAMPAPVGAVLTAVREGDFAELRTLAQIIWRRHYAAIIPAAQIEYMLEGRLSDEALGAQIRTTDVWLELLRVSGAAVGYYSSELADDCRGAGLPAMKLGQLYVLDTHRGLGLGRFMLGHVERRARELGRREVWLQVNRRNASAIGFYEALGFTKAREAVFDIGSGFVMDDYLMAKAMEPAVGNPRRLPAPQPPNREAQGRGRGDGKHRE